MSKINLINRLFRNSFILIAILYFFTLMLLGVIVILKNSYKLSLQNEFATKQPHIKIKYISQTSNIKQDIKLITSIKDVKAVTPFIEGERFFSSIGFKMGGNAQYNGNIKIIGMGSKSFVYDFFSAKFVSKPSFLVKYTPIEFIYDFRHKNNIMVFNQTLLNSYFPVIESTNRFEFISNKDIYNGNLAAIFNDFDKKAIIYTNLAFAKKLLHKDKIDGFFVNAKSVNDIDKLTNKLKEILPKDKFIVSSWLELRQKQHNMFMLFEVLSYLIIFIMLFLSILFILLLLYNSIIKKSYQLSVLYTIGFILKKEIFLYILFIISGVSFLAGFVLFHYSQMLVFYFNLPFYKEILFRVFIYFAVLDIIALISTYFLINTAYKIKAKSVF